MAGARATKIRLGVAGLGRGFSLMLPAFSDDPRVVLSAAADPRAEARQRFEADCAGRTFETAEALCAAPELDVIYVATPHQLHMKHAVLAAQHGKHVLVEKPMALTLAECQAMISAARMAGVRLMVGHSHSFDAPYRRVRELIASGRYGAVKMITALNYTDFLYRPRRAEELDPAQGGGAVLNQAAHQVDIVRMLGGGKVTSVRAITGTWDKTRPVEGAYAALLTFENGAFASLTYGGYGGFDTDVFENWIGEMGQAKQPNGSRRAQSIVAGQDESAFKASRNYGGASYRPQPPPAAHQHFGTLIVSCERADLRPMPTGVAIHDASGMAFEPLATPAVPRVEVIDELYDAVTGKREPLHSGEWAMATLEVCLAMLQSAREGRDIALSRQTGLP